MIGSFFVALGSLLFCVGSDMVKDAKFMVQNSPISQEQIELIEANFQTDYDPETNMMWEIAAAGMNMTGNKLRRLRARQEFERQHLAEKTGIPWNENYF